MEREVVTEQRLLEILNKRLRQSPGCEGHRHNVIHRDIKPANILLQDGEPVVADFGIALPVGAAAGDRLTETGLSLGTRST